MSSSIGNYGVMTPHSVGIIMKEAVRRGMAKVNELRFIFESEVKTGYSGRLDDVVSTADRAAQEIYVRVIRENFPGYGIVAEEGKETGARLVCTIDGVNWYFTIDPLDGTKAYVRKQSHGIGSMISLVRDGKIEAAFVGDVISGEIYGYRPDSERVHRIPVMHPAMPLSIDESLPLSRQYVLLRTDAHKHSEFLESLFGTRRKRGIFRGSEITGGSIGLSMARLWKGEVGAAVLRPGHNTPWDICPVVGITLKMGFVFLRVVETSLSETQLEPKHFHLEPYEPVVSTETVYVDHETLIVHRSRLDELSRYMIPPDSLLLRT